MENEKYGSAPIIFMDEKKREEWLALPEHSRKKAMSLLLGYAQEFEMKHSIDILANAIIDLSKRIDDLEQVDKKASEV